MPYLADSEQLKFLNGLIVLARGSAKIINSNLALAHDDYERAFKTYAAQVSYKIDINKEWQYLQSEDIGLLKDTDPDFPSSLSKAPNAPRVLYYRGNLAALENRRCAIVGTRRITDYGRRATRDIAGALAQAGIGIVSGMAIGIDAAAHSAAIEANVPTIAVLGAGLDSKTLYPRYNFKLAQNILDKGGLLISEYPAGMPAAKYTFRDRNRIVAALAEAVFIIEADIKSGSLITAHLALEMGLDVGAVPGNIYSNVTRGTHLLIRNGAAAITCGEDALELLGLHNQPAPMLPGFETPNSAILAAVQTQALTLDAIARAVERPVAEVAVTLAIMEADKIVECVGGKYARRQRS